MDSLEEGRTPLLRGNREDDLVDGLQRNSHHSDYLTTQQFNNNDGSINERNLESSTVKRLHHLRLPEDRWKAGVICKFLE